MVVEYIRYACSDTKRRDELIEAYRAAARALDQAPECLGYELTLCEEDHSSATLRIEWQSTEAHLQQFRASPLFREFFAAIGGFVKEIAEMRHYTLTNVVRHK